jgi:hypothetical protein
MRFLAGVLVGLLLACLSGAAQLSQGTAPTVQWDSNLSTLTGPVSFTFWSEGRELLRIEANGDTFYRGRLLGTDREIWWGLATVLSPGEWCQRWEESLP